MDIEAYLENPYFIETAIAHLHGLSHYRVREVTITMAQLTFQQTDRTKGSIINALAKFVATAKTNAVSADSYPQFKGLTRL